MFSKMKRVFLSLIFTLTVVFGFNSCVKYIDPNSYVQTKEEVLTDNFNTAFGVTESEYANHRWGMNTMPLVVSNVATTRSANTNANQWEDQGYVLPAEITTAEIEKVKAVFAKKGEASYTSLVDWDCFFVQQVYKGDSVYINGAGGTVTGAEHMDWLCAVTNKHVNVINWWPYEEEIVIGDIYDDHINNFNNGNCTTSAVSEKTGITIKGTMLMCNSNTNKFGFKSSEDNGHVFYNFRMEKIDGAYYVGFDFEAAGQNPNEKVARDFVYDDWIVKIVPGHGMTLPARVRVMGEDLGTSRSDFDYNDIVFDILFIKEGDVYKADIILQAAGGTLPLYIGEGEDNEFEVHELFGVSTDIMINTRAEDYGLNGRSDLDPVPITIILPSGKEYATMKAEDAVDALNIRVRSNNNTIRLHPAHSTGYDDISNAPKLIVVPVGTEWPDERIRIDNVYPKFIKWIKDETVEWWNN